MEKSDELVWLKPATWVAIIALVFTLSINVFGWGQSSKTFVSNKEFKQAMKDLKHHLDHKIKSHTEAGAHPQVKGLINDYAANKIEIVRLKGDIKIIKLKMKTLADRQSRGFSRVERRLQNQQKTMTKTSHKVTKILLILERKKLK